MRKLLYTLILIPIVAITFMYFFKPVKANQLEPIENAGVYIEMEYTEYEVFNNGIDIIYELEVVNPLFNDSGGGTSDLLLYMTQQYQTAVWVLPLPHVYYIEVQTPAGKERISTYVKTLVFNNYNDTLEGYASNGLLGFTISYNDIVEMNGSKMYAWRNSTTGMAEYQEIYNEGYANGYGKGYDYGYDIGYDKGSDYGYGVGKDEGYAEGYNEGKVIGNNEGYAEGYNEGYNEGLITNPNNHFGAMIGTVLAGVGSILSVELLPNITIGAVIAVPIIFGIISFVLGRRKD